VWHRKLALALRSLRHYDEAIVYYERAMELDPDLVLARGGLAGRRFWRDVKCRYASAASRCVAEST
jgi:tetratricopeptide (TPR) repeat protein